MLDTILPSGEKERFPGMFSFERIIILYILTLLYPSILPVIIYIVKLLLGTGTQCHCRGQYDFPVE